jgi:hypothetical protein
MTKFAIEICLALILSAIIYIYIKIGNIVIKWAGIFILSVIFMILLFILFTHIKGFISGLSI